MNTTTSKKDEYQEKLDSVKDWGEAVKWVGHAVKLECERLRVGGEPEDYLNAETLRRAWERLIRG